MRFFIKGVSGILTLEFGWITLKTESVEPDFVYQTEVVEEPRENKRYKYPTLEQRGT